MTEHEKLVERVARRAATEIRSYESCKHTAEYGGCVFADCACERKARSVTTAALAEVYAALREPNVDMFFDPDDVCVNIGQSPWTAFCEIYTAMLQASPLNPEN